MNQAPPKREVPRANSMLSWNGRPAREAGRVAFTNEAACPPTSVAADHHVGRLDHRVSLLAHLQLEFVDRFIGDRRGHDPAAAQIDAHVRGRRSLDDVEDRSVKLVAGADFHPLLIPGICS